MLRGVSLVDARWKKKASKTAKHGGASRASVARAVRQPAQRNSKASSMCGASIVAARWKKMASNTAKRGGASRASAALGRSARQPFTAEAHAQLRDAIIAWASCAERDTKVGELIARVMLAQRSPSRQKHYSSLCLKTERAILTYVSANGTTSNAETLSRRLCAKATTSCSSHHAWVL